MTKRRHYVHESADKREDLGISWKSGEHLEIIFQAPSLNAAFEFAEFLKSEGLCRFFRGHRCHKWLPEPTLMRLDEDGMNRELAKTRQFISWVEVCSKSCNLNYETDALWAIAQHYGYRTVLLDLTTDPAVACTFAAPCVESLSDESESCPIGALLLYTDSYLDFLKAVGKDGVELIKIDVANLWRLEAQCGLFLRLQIAEICTYSLPDRIEFPQPENGFEKSVEVYPKEKSELELLIDRLEHFAKLDNSKTEFASFSTVIPIAVAVDSVLDATPRLASAQDMHLTWIESEVELHETLGNAHQVCPNVPLRTLPNTLFKSYWRFQNGYLEPHPSWFSTDALRWLSIEASKFTDNKAQANTVNLTLTPIHDGEQSMPIATEIGSDVDRTRSRWFAIKYPDLQNRLSKTELLRIETLAGNRASLLWDGLRGMPVDDELFRLVINTYLSHLRKAMWSFAAGKSPSRRSLTVEDDGFVEIELRGIGGHAMSVSAPCDQLRLAVRDDLDEQVEQTSAWGIEVPDGFPCLTQMIYPQYLFDFTRFVRLYLLHILPYEVAESVVYHPEGSFYFNPRQIKIFGMA